MPVFPERRKVDRTRAKAEMKALTSELKRDAPAEAVMKSRARELGIEFGSRLERVLEATSERNKQFYIRHGFEATGEITLTGGPTMWPMWRLPR